MTEKEISEIWQNQVVDKDRLAAKDGTPVKIISPGRANDDRGPDFRDAVIVMGTRLIRGDVELHVKTSDWQAHGHHLDAIYNRVVLHVTFRDDTGSPVQLQSGRKVPTLALDRYLTNDTRDSVLQECHSDRGCGSLCQQQAENQAGELLDKAGDERFLIKSKRIKEDWTRVWPGQSLYQGVMGALGYSCNKLPFLELASRLPLRVLETATAYDLPDDGWLLPRQALLLGTAGLLPLMRQNNCYRRILDSEWLAELERLWDGLSPPAEVMSRCDWHLKPVRPNNSPVFRLLAMSYLLLRYREKGWLGGLTSLVSDATSGRGGHKHLEKGLVVTVNNLRSSGPSSKSRDKGRLSLLGSQRAADIAVNILLPFTYAWSRSIFQTEAGDKALELYRLYPKLTTNSIEQRMTQVLGIKGKPVNSARRQQGLLHIHHTFCETGRCGECNFSCSPTPITLRSPISVRGGQGRP